MVKCESFRSPEINNFPLRLNRERIEYKELFYIVDVSTFKQIEVPRILIDSIASFGFYGGMMASSNRLDPEKLIQFFHLN